MATIPAIASSIAYAPKTNAFGDTLPVIPKDSRVSSGSVLFRLDFEVLFTRLGKPAKDTFIQFLVSGVYSHAKLLKSTDQEGKATLRLETRYSGKNTITPQSPEFAGSTYEIDIGEAWYEATFLITAYNCCDEGDFSGDLVEGKNVGKHKQDFLFGGTGVVMQGTGLGANGKYIQIANPTKLSWNPGYAGVSNPEDAVFQYTDGVHGAYGTLTADGSIAIDPAVLPKKHRVNIITRTLGERCGMDTGGAIKGHHFDNYVGTGKAAIDAWTAAGGNITDAKVKYLGK